jgi:hypothetical protein
MVKSGELQTAHRAQRFSPWRPFHLGNCSPIGNIVEYQMTSYLPPKTSSLACADTEHTTPLEQDMNASTDTTDTVPNQMESTESYEDFIPTPGRIPKSIMSALGYELAEIEDITCITPAHWIVIRKTAGMLIDPETAEVMWLYEAGIDEGPGLPDRKYFVRCPGNEEWVWFYDLPETTRSALAEKYASKWLTVQRPGGRAELQIDLETAKSGNIAFWMRASDA